MRPKKNSGKKSVRSMRPVALSQLNMLKGLHITSHASRLAAFMLFAYLTGCAAPQQQVKRRYFWPPLPDQPRLEWAGSYENQYSLPRTGFENFIDSLAGQSAPLNFVKPWGIASDGKGKVYIADTRALSVIVYDFNSNKVEELVAGETPFDAPIDVTLDDNGNVYVSDSKKNAIFVFTKDKKPLFSIAKEGVLDWPAGMAVDNAAKRLYVANSHRHNIVAFDLTGKHLFTFGKRGSADGDFNYPTDVAVDSKGHVIVVDSMNARVQIFDREGQFIRKFGQRGDGPTDFQLIKGIAVSSDDRIFLTDTSAHRIMIFDMEGQSLLTFGVFDQGRRFIGGFSLPQGIDIDRKGRVYVVDSLNKRFQVFQIVDEEWLKKNPIEEQGKVGVEKKK